MRRRCRIVAFHQTSRTYYPGINNIHPRDFEHVLGLVESWGYIWHDFPALDRQHGDAAVAVSFDDGYEDNLPVIEDLIERGIAPAVFIPTAYIGKKNSWEYSSRLFPARHLDRGQIKQLAEKNVTIGSHGVSHRALTVMPDDTVRRELCDSKTKLEDITGRPVDVISFPFGRTNRRVTEIAQACGYRRGFTLGETAPAGSNTDEFTVSRIPIYRADNYFSLRAKLCGESSRERLKDRIINMLAAGTIIVRGRLK